MVKAIQIDGDDNVATVTSNVGVGEVVEVLSPEGSVLITPKVVDNIEFGHKLALHGLNVGENVVKYGEVIGVASKPISVGAWVHTHNVESAVVPTSSSEVE
jgi:altronate dehydratase small subunit